MTNVLRACAAGAVLFLTMLLCASTTQAQQRFGDGRFQVVRAEQFTVAPEDVCVLHPGEQVPRAQIVPRAMLQRAPYQQTATIEVDYQGFDGAEGQQAQDAFQRAIDIWEQHVSSPVVIKVDASFAELGENVLGSAGPTDGTVYFVTVDGEESLYSPALTDAVTGEDQAPDESDIVARFSSEADWYYGTGEPGAGQIDFTSVVLHELGHGLGFFGSMSVQNVDDDPADEGVWPFDPDNPEVPVIYDRFAEDAGGTSLINTVFYPNPSEALADVLTGESVFFNGTNTRIGTGGARAELYAPDEWRQGSSYSHLDEGTYPAGDEDALMSPLIGFGEVITSPGAITCGMFADMGWPLGPGCEALLQSDLVDFAVEPLGQEGRVEVNWLLNPDSDKDRFEVQRRAFPEQNPDSAFETVEVLTRDDGVTGDDGFVAFTYTNDLGVGRYAFRLLAIDESEGDTLRFLSDEAVKIGLLGAPGEKIDAEPAGDFSAAVNLSWSVPPATGAYNYEVQRCDGSFEDCIQGGGDFQAVGIVTGSADQDSYDFVTDLLSPDDYTFRLRMVEAGNPEHVVFSEPQEVTVELELSFETALVSDYRLDLQWHIPPATGAYRYEVQRCIGDIEICTGEGAVFQTAEVVDGTAAMDNYRVEVDLLGPGDYTFRLRIVDPDGQETVIFSELQEVNVDLAGAFALSSPYPNPVIESAQLNLTVDAEQIVTVQVYGMLGRRVRQREVPVSANQAELIRIETRGLASGKYVVRILGESFTASRSFIVVR